MSKWEWKKLGEVCEFKDSQRKPITASKRISGPYPYYGATGVLDYVDGFLFDEDLILLGEDGAKWGSGDKSAFVISGKTWVNNHAHVLKPDSSIDYQWLIYFLNFSDLMKYVKGATVPKLNQENAKNILVPVPPLSEQKRIVKFLDEEFSKIDTLKTNAETNLKNAKVFFQKKIANEFTINAEKLKQGWIETTVGDIADIKGGKRIPKGEKLLTKKTKHPYIRVTDFNDDGSVDLDDIHYISDEIYEGIKRYIITTEDAYVSIAGTIGKCGIIPLELNNANLTENACRLIFNTNIYNRFFVYFSLSDEFKALTQKETRANAMPKLSILRLSQIQIPLPPLSVQKEIVARLDKLSENVKRLEANYKQIIANCDELKKSILKKTFEGDSRSSRE